MVCHHVSAQTLFPLFLCSIEIFCCHDPRKFHLDSRRGLRANSTKFDQIRPKKYFESESVYGIAKSYEAGPPSTFEFWSLGFVWDLGFGVWDFAATPASEPELCAVHVTAS